MMAHLLIWMNIVITIPSLKLFLTRVISLCSHGNEEDLQLDNTYHCSLDDYDASIIIDDVIECENDVMSQPWGSEHHLEQNQQRQQ